MSNSRKTRIFSGPVFLAVFLASFFFFRVLAAAADSTSTIRGAAWWGNLGYIYFNCLDDIIGDRLDVSSNLSGSGQYTPPNDKFHFYSQPCHDLVHGVYLDSLDRLSGEAWNPTMDLITFDATTTPPGGFSSHCSGCNLSNSCMACYVRSEQKAYGWARVLSTGDWIRLDNATSAPVRMQDWDLSDSVLPGHDVQAGDFVGYATSTLGDISFNCESEDACATRDYKVYVSDLKIGAMSAPNWSYSQACGGQALSAVLKWYKESGQYPYNGEIVSRQTAYEVVVNNSNNLSTTTAVCWSGKKISSSASQYVLPNSDPNCGSLSYNTNYYWWVRLYDENDEAGEWYQYSGNSATDTDGDPDSNSLTFTTFKHEFPSPYFTWDPYDVTVGTTTVFTSNSYYYNPLQQSCAPGLCNYLWTTTDPMALISAATNSTTSIIFFRATGTRVTLQVTDSDNYVCSTSTVLMINYGLPIWREVKSKGNL